MVSAVHRSRGGSGAGGYLASKGLHMVSAVHLYHCAVAQRVAFVASKGLHMVSAVHRIVPQHRHENIFASKGLHMVSAVHRGDICYRQQRRSFKGAAHG